MKLLSAILLLLLLVIGLECEANTNRNSEKGGHNDGAKEKRTEDWIRYKDHDQAISPKILAAMMSSSDEDNRILGIDISLIAIFLSSFLITAVAIIFANYVAYEEGDYDLKSSSIKMEPFVEQDDEEDKEQDCPTLNTFE